MTLYRDVLEKFNYSHNLIKYIFDYENAKNAITGNDRKYHNPNFKSFHEFNVLTMLMEDKNFSNYLSKELFYLNENEDTYLKLLIQEQGFSGLPQMVEMEEYLSLAEKQQVYCRGTRRPNAQLIFKHDEDMFIGKGHYANGVYFAKAESLAKLSEYNLTGFIENDKINYSNQFLIAGVLDKKAKVIESNELDNEIELDCNNLKYNNNNIAYDINTLRKFFLYNRSAYAVIKGYDAIIPNTVAEKDELILLNRTCMILPKVLGLDFASERSLKK